MMAFDVVKLNIMFKNQDKQNGNRMTGYENNTTKMMDLVDKKAY